MARSVASRIVSSQVRSRRLVDERRGRIIAAAINVFHEKGFHGATTSDISRAAGMTQSNIYNYVRSKQDVLFLVCDHLLDGYNDVIDTAIASSSDSRERVILSINNLVDAMAKNKDAIQILYSEIPSLEADDKVRAVAMLSEITARFEDLIKAYNEQYPPLLVSERRLAGNLMSFVPAIIALRSWDMRAHGHQKIRSAIIQFMLNGLGVDTDAPAHKRVIGSPVGEG